MWRERDELCMRLRVRKNRLEGSGTMRRACSCQATAALCPIHVLWDLFLREFVRQQPFCHISPALARDGIRATLAGLSVPNAAAYGTHDFRRGHAKVRRCLCGCAFVHGATPVCQDMQRDGSSLAQILKAGQWKSSAFLKYLDEEELEKARSSPLVLRLLCSTLVAQDVVLAAGMDSDSEEWID